MESYSPTKSKMPFFIEISIKIYFYERLNFPLRGMEGLGLRIGSDD